MCSGASLPPGGVQQWRYSRSSSGLCASFGRSPSSSAVVGAGRDSPSEILIPRAVIPLKTWNESGRLSAFARGGGRSCGIAKGEVSRIAEPSSVSRREASEARRGGTRPPIGVPGGRLTGERLKLSVVGDATELRTADRKRSESTVSGVFLDAGANGHALIDCQLAEADDRAKVFPPPTMPQDAPRRCMPGSMLRPWLGAVSRGLLGNECSHFAATPWDRSPGRQQKPWISRAFYKRMKGLEPSTFCMASRRSSQLSYIRVSRPV